MRVAMFYCVSTIPEILLPTFLNTAISHYATHGHPLMFFDREEPCHALKSDPITHEVLRLMEHLYALHPVVLVKSVTVLVNRYLGAVLTSELNLSIEFPSRYIASFLFILFLPMPRLLKDVYDGLLTSQVKDLARSCIVECQFGFSLNTIRPGTIEVLSNSVVRWICATIHRDASMVSLFGFELFLFLEDLAQAPKADQKSGSSSLIASNAAVFCLRELIVAVRMSPHPSHLARPHCH
ncbi:uncharacterized protein BJ171DRAFT_9748 [Polychytrium aggregatum]|uniref:uncharacterized protein n=1 Tax=Polychytrium aggregatum TaxID=110093 RepID=UPI0022FF0B7D|nr:uncharacterized protein BJ171DRAFT_9748 [Polychytrium aggregatum]KAI9209860.1 hypothetical protein BJ171DRAFT_9748 [Polychytrium aggregatum]